MAGLTVPNSTLYESSDPTACPVEAYDAKHGRYDGSKANVQSKQLAQPPSMVSPFRLTAK